MSLRPVGVSEDGSRLILARRANAKNGGFRLLIDDELIEKIREAHRLSLEARAAAELENDPPAEEESPAPAPAPDPQPAPRGRQLPPEARLVDHLPPSQLTVKEVQALLRRGQTVASIAKKAGVKESWVERFEGPIIWERAGIADRAKRATLVRTRSGPSALPLGEAVLTNLRSKNVDLDQNEFDSAWTSVMRANRRWWMIQFTYFSRGRTHRPRWEFDPEENEIIALDNLANDLGWVEPRRRPRKR